MVVDTRSVFSLCEVLFARNVGSDGSITVVVKDMLRLLIPNMCSHMIYFGLDRSLVVLVCGASWWFPWWC